jgi:glycosyltransferase involved in cell wall biosynthesis
MRVKVWIVNVNEPLPTDPGNNRPWRMGNVFQLLKAGGHDVTWWSSTMHHFDKRLRYDTTTEVKVADNARVIHLHGRHYKRNISLDRLLNHQALGRAFRDLATQKSRPDIILASIPILDLPREAVRYGRLSDVPVVMDVRDKWPDFMVDQAPAVARPLARLLLHSLFNDLREACTGAAAIWGVAPSFVEWGLAAAGRQAQPQDRYFPNAYPDTPMDRQLLAGAAKFWDDKGIAADDSVPTLCFIGSLNFTAFDFDTLVEGMRRLVGKARLVVCGSGVGEEKLREMAADLPNVIFPGWVDGPALRVIMQRSAIGLTPYRNNSNFTENLPNKFLEYMSQGLPIVSCLEGYSRQVLEEGQVARFYAEGDPEAFAGAIGHLLDAPDDRQKMGQAARALFEKEFRAETVYGQLVEDLERLARVAQ